jgi:hypothetical protein
MSMFYFLILVTCRFITINVLITIHKLACLYWYKNTLLQCKILLYLENVLNFTVTFWDKRLKMRHVLFY